MPRVSDHFIDADGHFLVMEYIPGNDLSIIAENT
jgi:serine/threonine protein kinase